ncbi:MAG: hypothetical protein JNK00_05540 [Flavipsychrobacter sp.]|nr:hypothetical protein [Flavipsychrobacter sp.]
MLRRVLLLFFSLLVSTTINAQAYKDMLIDYGRVLPVYNRDGALNKTYLFNIGLDVFNYNKEKPLSIVMGARAGVLKNDEYYTDEYKSTYIWGTKFQAGFVAGAKLQHVLNRHMLECGIAVGPMHMVSIDAGDINKPTNAIITESFAYAELTTGLYLGAKFIHYPAFFDHKIRYVPNSAQSIVAISLRIAI